MTALHHAAVCEEPEGVFAEHAAVCGTEDRDAVRDETGAVLKTLEELDLPSEDGIPLETNWHRIQMNLLIDSLHWLWRDRRDYFAGGNMFVYFSLQQAKNRDYRGPDFFVVKDTDGTLNRNSWVLWNEGGRYPDVIVELASPSTIKEDLGTKKNLYEQVFRTPDYFCYDPDSGRLRGWELTRNGYKELTPDGQGRMHSRELGVRLGTWQGEYQRVTDIWLRFYTDDGQLVPTSHEAEAQRAENEAQRAEAEAQRAEAEAQRAEAAEAELKRLRELLAKQGITNNGI
jgi:Uma2 family endonuclease